MITGDILKHNLHHRRISGAELYRAYKIFFGTLVSESRLKILNLLRKGRKNVSEIINELKIDQTAVSHDLARLRRCGFVLAERDGKFMYYSLNKRTISPLLEMIDKHMSQYCVHILREVKGGR
jgi:DNA-binding transcriptional ArsR family regulator